QEARLAEGEGRDVNHSVKAVAEEEGGRRGSEHPDRVNAITIPVPDDGDVARLTENDGGDERLALRETAGQGRSPQQAEQARAGLKDADIIMTIAIPVAR